ncbi:MAG: HDOD domain-containing protein [Alishewanella sp.]|nr:HDOD domain-containing protein [Alishewanella sp.]MDP5036960.1 HDOD domain-containing protein [Alishewanella sp.]MDP5188179.1 HDOD domain-containing protein [Alishewanella sp.]
MTRLNVLFIDDDSFMLKALHRVCRRLKPDYHFVLCEQQSMWQSVWSESTPPDVVFCDYLMPMRNGDKVLEEIACTYPSAVRVLLTGDVTEEVLSKASEVAHFVLSKPFAENDLNHVFLCLERLNALKFPQVSRAKLGQIGYFFVLPELALKLQDLFSQPDVDIKDVTDHIMTDSVITAKIIQFANSAFLGYRVHTTSLAEAIKRLGLRLVEAIVISISVEQQVSLRIPLSVYKHCSEWTYRYAAACRQNSKTLGFSTEMQDFIYVAALLTGLGHFSQALEQTDYDPDAESKLIDIEQALCYKPSTMSAVYFLTLWGFPSDICKTVLFQDKPPFSGVGLNEKSLSLVMFVTKLSLLGSLTSEAKQRIKTEINDTATMQWLELIMR